MMAGFLINHTDSPNDIFQKIGKAIIDKHGGTLRFEDRPSSGCFVYLWSKDDLRASMSISYDEVIYSNSKSDQYVFFQLDRFITEFLKEVKGEIE